MALFGAVLRGIFSERDLLAEDQARTVRAIGTAALEKRSSTSDLTNPAPWLAAYFGGTTASSGAVVGEGSASTVATFMACVDLLSDMVAKMPLKLRQITANGSEVASEVPAHKLVAVDPGGSTTPFELRKLMMTGVGFGGNGYARVHRDRYYAPGELEWLRPCDVRPEKIGRDRRYWVTGVKEPLTRADIIHTRTVSMDNVTGLSPVRLLRESLGLSLTQREQAGKVFANGARFPGFFTMPGVPQKGQMEQFRSELEKLYTGAENSGRQPILSGGVDYKTVNGMTLSDAEFLESRKFEAGEIAKFFRIPQILFGDSEKTSSWGTGVETITNGFLTFTLDGVLRNWEYSLNYTLLSEEQKAAGFYFQFNRRALLAVDLKTQAEFLRVMRDIGVYSVNDCRRYLEENDLPDHIGDDYGLPFNGSGGRPSAEAKPQPANTETQ